MREMRSQSRPTVSYGLISKIIRTACVTVSVGAVLVLWENRPPHSQEIGLPNTVTNAVTTRSKRDDIFPHKRPPSIQEWTLFPQGYDPDTEAIQGYLHSHQNPEDCENRRYVLWNLNNYGIGSDLHTLNIGLSFAIRHKRVLLYHPHNNWAYTSSDVCNGTLTPDCFFQPLSRCQYVAKNLTLMQEQGQVVRYQASSIETEKAKFVGIETFRDALEYEFVPNVSDWQSRNNDSLWWLTQTARFLLRPNTRLLDLTRDYFTQDLVRHPLPKKWNATRNGPPQKAICIHIRHGDKYKEMRLHPSLEYMESADALVRDHPSSLSRNIFFSTDNQSVVEEIENGAFDRFNFTFYYTRYERRKDDLSPVDTASVMGKGRFGSISFANLILGVHPNCNSFVGTLESNWNRLIDEIRRTDGVRQDAYLIDLKS